MDSRGTWGRSVCGHRSILSSWLVRSFFIATLLFWARIADSQPIDPDVVRFQPDLANKGAVLFNRDWQSKDPLCPDGDGLGPMFNAKSCQACHWMGNSGGAGSNRDNVSVLTWVGGKALTTPQPRNSHRLVTSRVHSAVNVNRRSTVFHHSSTDDGYDPWRKRILGPGTNSAMTVSLATPSDRAETPSILLSTLALHSQKKPELPVITLPQRSGETFVLTQRNTPALWGMVLIDRIPEQAILDVAQEQSRALAGLGQGVHGRVARLASKRVGRFGWRGHVESLEKFVLTACAVELGLSSKQCPEVKPPHKFMLFGGNDLSDQQTMELVEFVVSLPRPKQRQPATDVERSQLIAGEAVFESIGCAVCHRAELGGVKQLYSDLLLHDLGAGLADPATEATATGLAIDPQTLQREWRTPPLWGVADSGPWLHDGRAETLHEAILWHGGEAAGSVQRYRQLNSQSQQALVTFLMSLESPFPTRSRNSGGWGSSTPVQSWGNSRRRASQGVCICGGWGGGS